jgi:rod shape-determining protein MreC
MKTNYLQDKRLRRTAVITIAVLSIMFFLVSTNTFSASNGISNVGSFIWNFRDIVGEKIDEFFLLWTSKKSLDDENRALKDTIRSNEIAILQNKILAKENSDFKKLFGYEKESTSTVMASVLVRPPQTLYDTLIISAGKDRNVTPNEKVFAYDNIYIGKVAEVYANSSKVALLSSPGEKWNVNIGGNSMSAVAKGMGAGNFLVELPKDAEVEKGDYVMLSDSGDLIGKVYFIETSESDSFKKIFIHSPFNISEIRWTKIAK